MTKNTSRLLAALCVLALASAPVAAKRAAPAIPHLVQNDGHYALLVDGKPFTMLGVQAHRVALS